MKTESILIKFSKEEVELINKLYKKEIVNNDLISRSEFIRRAIKEGLKVLNEEQCQKK